jgi:hypothetical protein
MLSNLSNLINHIGSVSQDPGPVRNIQDQSGPRTDPGPCRSQDRTQCAVSFQNFRNRCLLSYSLYQPARQSGDRASDAVWD